MRINKLFRTKKTVPVSQEQVRIYNSFSPEIVISLVYKKHLVVAARASPFPTPTRQVL